MAQIVGYVKEIVGKFVARSKDGSERVLKVGDPIYADDLVFDPTHNPQDKIVIDLVQTKEHFVIDGEAEVLFDASVTSVEPMHTEATLAEADVSAALAGAGADSKEDAIDQLLKEFGDIDVDETALGKEDVMPASHSEGDRFANGTNAMADVNAGLRSVDSHNYTLEQPLDPFSPVEGTAGLTVPESVPVYVPPTEEAHTPFVPPVHPPVTPEIQNTVSIVDGNGDGIVNLSEAGNISVTGRVQPGSSVGTLLLTDGSTTIEIPSSQIRYNPTTGEFNVTGIDVSSLKDGEISVSVTVTDAAGNSATAEDSIEKDTTPPTVGITLDAVTDDNVVNAAEAGGDVSITGTVSGEYEAGDRVTLTVNGKAYEGEVDADGKFSVAVPGSELTGDSDHTVEASITVTDAAGNSAEASATEQYGVDTTAPSVSVKSIDLTNDATPEISGSVDDPNATVVVTIDGESYTATNNGDGTWTLPDDTVKSLTDGKHEITVEAVDAAGNKGVGSGSVTVDTQTAASVDIKDDSGHDDYLDSHDDLARTQLSGRIEAGGHITALSVTDGTNTITIDPSTVTVDDEGNWSTTVDTGSLKDGTVTVKLAAEDAAGNSATAEDSIEKDTTPPTVGITLDAVTDDNVVNAAEAGGDVSITGTVSGEYEAGDRVTLTVNGKAYEGEVDADGKFSVAVPGSELTGDSDHTVEASITVTDAAGNSAEASATEQYGVDTTAPSVSVKSIDLTNDATPEISGSVDDPNATVVVTIDGESYTATNNGDGTWTLPDDTVKSLTDGKHEITVEAVDAAGNKGVGSGSVTVDTQTAASVDIKDDSGHDDYLDSHDDLARTQLSGRIEAGGHITALSVTDGTNTITIDPSTVTVDDEGNWSTTVDTGSLKDGTVTVKLAAEDAAGNSATAEDSIEKDTTPPTVGITLDAVTDDNVVNAAEAGGDVSITGTVSGEYEAGDRVTLTVNGKAYEGEVDADGKFSVAVPGSELTGDSDHTVEASITVTDAAGNSAEASATEQYGVDTTAPSVSVKSIDLTNDATPEISGSVDDPNATVVVTIDGESYTATNNGDGTWTLPDDTVKSLTDGKHEITVEAVDAAGNKGVGSGSVTVDTQTAASVDIKDDSGHDDYLDSHDDLARTQLSGRIEAGGHITALSVTDGTNTITIDPSTVTVDDEGNWSTTVDTGSLKDGTVTVKLAAEDAAGNSATAEDSIEKDTTETASIEKISEDSGDEGDFITNDNTLVFEGKADPGSTVEIRLDDTSLGTVTADSDGKWIFDNTSAVIEDGNHQIKVTATDEAGNVATAQQSLTVDSNGVADAPVLDVKALSETKTIIIDSDNVNETGNGYTVTAYNPDGSTGTIGVHRGNPPGFGVKGRASGDDVETGYNSNADAPEQVSVKFDQPIYSVNVALAWNAPDETADMAFYRNGERVEEIVIGNGSDEVDPLIHFAPSNGEAFDEIRLYPPGEGDDFLINKITFDATELNDDGTVHVKEGTDIEISVDAQLTDTDGSENLVVEVEGIKKGSTLYDDAGHSYTATSDGASVNVSDWQLDTLRYATDESHDLTFKATSQEMENGAIIDTKTVEKTLTVEVASSDDTYLFEPGKTVDGMHGEDTLVLHENETIDFSNLPDGTHIKNMEKIDLTAFDNHEIKNLTLNDVIEMTDERNTLVIDGDRGDKVNIPDAPAGYDVTHTSEGGYDIYTYTSTSGGDPTVTLKIDQDVHHS
ncbi:Ig-like domain-containing protein [Hydrogenimonas sp. SS33]|uniref:Ig-like domain-containing protein n=1 Tax=Hydrogenimonas leucolamina TaxID=2954236 RepID=UPI00336BE33B